MFRSRLMPLGVAIILAYCGVGLIKTAVLLGGTAGEFAGGVFLIIVGVWMVFATLTRSVLR
jgi:putative Mn2+ efflux pump MntP